MDISVSFSKTRPPPFSPSLCRQLSLRPNAPQLLRFSRNNGTFRRKPPPTISRPNKLAVTAIQISNLSENEDDFVLEDVPHLTDFLPNLPVPLRCFSFSICFHDCDFVDKHVKPQKCRKSKKGYDYMIFLLCRFYFSFCR